MPTTTTPQQAQADYCRSERIPLFAPYSGICFSCSQDIYLPGLSLSGNPTAGISLNVAGTSHVKSCPHCSASYCD